MKKIVFPLLFLISVSFTPKNAFSTELPSFKPFSVYASDLLIHDIHVEEENLNIEGWMTDLDHWLNLNEFEATYSYQEVEKWMVNLDHWLSRSSMFYENAGVCYENEFHLEDWMKNPCHWNISLISCDSVIMKIPVISRTFHTGQPA